MSTKNDGGPAFPAVQTREAWARDSNDGYQVFGEVESAGGMTLRDYFAGKELSKTDGPVICDQPAVYMRLADHCYRMADAMLKARDAK